MHGKISIFWLVILVLAVIWLLNDLAILSIQLPWLPIIVGAVALGMLINKARKH